MAITPTANILAHNTVENETDLRYVDCDSSVLHVGLSNQS
jgi:hypothetical protein